MTMMSNLSRRWTTVGAWVVGVWLLGVALVAGVVHQNERDEVAVVALEPVAAPTAQDLARGAYLARVGNCAACHTARGGVPYAGGRGIDTPFGVVYAGNLTPDRQTGLGTWSAGDFWRAMHHGRSKDGRYLYPAFPYTNMTLVTRADADAIYAYLQTLPPVVSPQPAHTLRFPYNTQAALMVWRALFFRPAALESQPPADSPPAAMASSTPSGTVTPTAEWARGAYLARGLGHCNACHSARNALGASTSAPGQREFAGGMIPVLNWYAPSLHDDAEGGVAAGALNEVVSLLKTGVSPRGSALGPMAEVVSSSTQHWSDADLRAVAVFLQSLPRDKVPVSARAEVRVDLSKGRKLYERHCADCHGAQGEGAKAESAVSNVEQGGPWAYPPLAGNRAVTMGSAVNLVRVVRSGGFAPSTAGHPRPYGMPPFDLNNDDMAAVISYIRTSWGNQAAPISASGVLSGK